MRTTDILPASLVITIGFSLATGASRIIGSAEDKEAQDALIDELYKGITPAIDKRSKEIVDEGNKLLDGIKACTSNHELDQYLETKGTIVGDFISQELYEVIANAVEEFVANSALSDLEQIIEKAVLMAVILNNAVDHLNNVANRAAGRIKMGIMAKQMEFGRLGSLLDLMRGDNDTEDTVATTEFVPEQQDSTEQPQKDEA